ncbi:MAG: hypothetical protein Q8O35_10235 [Humidesulfovibrio sp.]|jgi:hypothetical protein|uniref:hypothetical protein n=1 Tax=Humidesulfovibrio sp. TaxID=2910988 RepID=UPI0027340A0E|nr:hypothetical protein [Humidesulfovibrio sp.]MDP2848555.1 hypothetical protein [Humidesulfovibrio sp.]
MRLKHLVISLAIVVMAASTALAGSPVIVHFFVVPASIPAEKLNGLNDYLIKTAGGFTASRSFGGAMGNLGKDYAPENLSYTVSAPRNVSGEISGYLKKSFGLKEVFLLTWPAERLDN